MTLNNIIIKAMITTTSNKTKEHFAPRKTAFLKVSNFKTTEHVMFPVNIIKGNKHNNDFYRLNAILCEEDNIETIKETNPFE